METLVLEVDPLAPDMGKIRKAADFIKKGGLVAFPTETVYGLGADALNAEAILKVFEVKKRPLDNPPIVHIGNLKMVERLTSETPSIAAKLMERFWPGPLTLIFRRSFLIPSVTVAGLDTIALRMPKHEVALALIRESGCPIAAPSANSAGRPSPTLAKHVLEDLGGRIDAVLDAGPARIGVESTVLDLTVDPPQVLRPGGLPFEDLQQVLDRVDLNPVVLADRVLPVKHARSPGVKHRHYAPRAEMVLVEGGTDAIEAKVDELVRGYTREGKRVGVLATNETVSRYDLGVVKSLGSRGDLADVAKNLFKLLRELDAEGVDVIIAEGVPAEGLGLAVLNRLRKASGYNIVRA